jgi:hypothetical protein
MAVVCQVARDPIDALTVLSEEISSRFGKTDGIQYDPDLDWEPDIHKLLCETQGKTWMAGTGPAMRGGAHRRRVNHSASWY